MNTPSTMPPDRVCPDPGASSGGSAIVGVAVIRTNGDSRLVANRPIAPGEHLFRIEGELTSQPTRYSVQVGHNRHIAPGPNHRSEEIMDRYSWRFMNHHCEPAVMIRGQDVFAVKAIVPGDDITFNYNTTELNMAEPFDCRCGSRHCLGKIGGFQHLGHAEQRRLLPLLAPHLAERLREPRPTPPDDGSTVPS